MFQGLNQIQIIGNLGRDPEMRYTPGGTPVTQFSVAVGRRRRTPEGEWVDDTDWFTVVCWERRAETVDSMASKGYLRKGTKVFVEGRLQVRRYTNSEGAERTAVEIVANQVLILSSRGDSAGGGFDREQVGTGTAGRRSEREFEQDDEDIDDVPF